MSAYNNQFNHSIRDRIDHKWGIPIECRYLIEDAIKTFDAKPARARVVMREKIVRDCNDDGVSSSEKIKRLKTLPTLKQVQNLKKHISKTDDNQVIDTINLNSW